MRKRHKKKLLQRQRALYFKMSKKGKTYPFKGIDSGFIYNKRKVIRWAKYFTNIMNRQVAYTEIGGVIVSTVFLSLNHDYCLHRPLLFETIFSDDDFGGTCWRYATIKDAKRGHKAAVELIMGSLHVQK